MQCPPGREPELDADAVQASMDRVDAMLALLPVKERHAVSLVVLEGRSLREAAPVMGLSKSQVDRLLKRGLSTLAELLGGDLPSGLVSEALAGLAPNEAPELGGYLEPAPQKADLPEVTAEDWGRYEAVSGLMRTGEASKTDLAFVVSFEKRVGLGSSFSPAWK